MGIVGVDLNHPAEAIRLIRLLSDVEPREVFSPPAVCLFLEADALIVFRFGSAGCIGAEVLVEVLPRGQHGPPGRDAARAVGERADDLLSGRVGTGFQARVSCRRAAYGSYRRTR